MKKKILGVCLATAVTATMLAGCGGDSTKTDSTKTDNTTTDSTKTEIGRAHV